MVELDKPFKKDYHNLWYLDSKNVKITPFKFSEIGKPYEDRPNFFKIKGIDDYIIKDTSLYPFFFNRYRTIRNLVKLQQKQELLPNIDFPIGYYKDKGMVMGTIIPYYPGAISLRELIFLHKLPDVDNYYYRDPNEIDNLIYMFLDILELISKMYEQNIVYLDIHTGNFLIYKNDVKVIDFEPGYVYYSDKNHTKYERMIINYAKLIERICRRLGFKEVLLRPSDTFMGMENNIKTLSKRLER